MGDTTWEICLQDWVFSTDSRKEDTYAGEGPLPTAEVSQVVRRAERWGLPVTGNRCLEDPVV